MEASDLNLLGVLDALLQEGSVTAAARRMGLSTPAMSHALARIRERLGDPILVRSGRGMLLTPRAEQLKPQIHAIVTEARQALSPTRPFVAKDLARTFVIHATDYVLTVLGPTVDRILKQESPHVCLRFVPNTPDDPSSLRDGGSDLAVGIYGELPQEMRIRHLLTELAAENYGIIDLDLDRPGEELRLQLKDAQGAVFASQSVALASLQVRPAVAKRTVVLWSPQRAYVFKGAEYVRYDLPPEGPPQPRSPRPIEAGWKGVFPEHPEVDAVLVSPRGKAYFFRGNGYVRYDIADDRADSGYPKYTARHFPGVWPDGLDAAAAWTEGKAYFFKGSQYVRYDIAADRVVSALQTVS